MKKQIENLGELLLKQVDNVGFQLDSIGVENQINRHNLIATVFAGQKRFEGELDSVKARVDSTKAQVEATFDVAEQYAKSGLGLVTFPATYVIDRVKQLS